MWSINSKYSQFWTPQLYLVRCLLRMLLLLAALVAGGCTVLTVLLILLQVPLFVVQCITMYQNL